MLFVPHKFLSHSALSFASGEEVNSRRTMRSIHVGISAINPNVGIFIMTLPNYRIDVKLFVINSI